jgi:hypothetical protein
MSEPQLSPDGRWWWDGQQWQPVTGRPAPLESVTVTPHKTNHTFHLLMTVFTLGLWSPVWLVVWMINTLRKDTSKTYRV